MLMAAMGHMRVTETTLQQRFNEAMDALKTPGGDTPSQRSTAARLLVQRVHLRQGTDSYTHETALGWIDSVLK